MEAEDYPERGSLKRSKKPGGGMFTASKRTKDKEKYLSKKGEGEENSGRYKEVPLWTELRKDTIPPEC